MRVVVQRVSEAAITIDGTETRKIQHGLVILLGISEQDHAEQAEYLADKCVGLRIFSDTNDKMNLSVADIDGALAIVSNFTLYGDCKKGKRPNFMRAARPDVAIPLYEAFIRRCRNSGVPVETGEFGADMQITMTNDGPVTIFMDTDDMK